MSEVCGCVLQRLCHCTVLTAYAQHCAQEGVLVYWRNQTLCRKLCITPGSKSFRVSRLANRSENCSNTSVSTFLPSGPVLWGSGVPGVWSHVRWVLLRSAAQTELWWQCWWKWWSQNVCSWLPVPSRTCAGPTRPVCAKDVVPLCARRPDLSSWSRNPEQLQHLVCTEQTPSGIMSHRYVLLVIFSQMYSSK